MKMIETTIRRSVRLAFAGGIALGLASLASPAHAQVQSATQDQSGASPQGPIARVEITGSNIRRSQTETASSVQTLTARDIQQSGRSTVAELLQTLAVDNQGSVPASFGNGFAAGASGISLRGLGAASTLVLLNGRRIAPYGLADDGQKVFADLNIIPTEAVERVEILKDGASAIYGSDAIAGVVNIILRRDFVGTTVRGSYGQSRYHDGRDTRFALTHGFGNLDTDKYNALFALEYGRKGNVTNYDRRTRDQIGRTDLRYLGFSAQQALGGTGAITRTNAAGSAVNGNVRNPTTLDYYNRGNLNGVDFTRTFPAAACSNFTNHRQGDPLGGCLTDATQEYGEIQPKQDTLNLFGRFTYQLTPELQTYAELNLYRSEMRTQTTPSGVSADVGSPAGASLNAGMSLGAAHPDNPYFGSAARLRYLATDVGPRTNQTDSTFSRALVGIKGTVANWDIDSALLFSQNKITREQGGYLQRNVAFALLNPTADNVAAASSSAAYAALPAGTYWRIAENAGLNSPALYAALSPTLSNGATSRIIQADFKASRELTQLPGGALGLAVGGEFRHEYSLLDPTPGTETGNIIGLGYSAYQGSRNVGALYAEVLAPVIKNVEVSGALRYDHFTDVGNSYTPKIGVKWTPVPSLALRSTFARGFRAPSSAENGRGGLAAYSTAEDPVRCALGVTTACSAASIAVITSPNPDLSPERSKNYSLGLVWAPLPRSSASIDFWQIKRKNEINQVQTTTAIANGDVVRDPSTADPAIPGDPGAISVVLANYVNSAQTLVRGVDLDLRHGINLGSNRGNLTLSAVWTHLFKWLRTEQDGTERDFAGTHGNCDITNCTGTPDDRVNLSASWERDAWRVTAMANFRGKLDNVLFKNDPDGCAFTYANGDDAPGGCKIASFTSIDLSVRWAPSKRMEVFATIQNLFDKVAPLDPLTYGATSYNPLDYSGALGRYYSAGIRYKF
jgi:iron complex outermembrane receptor protein